MSAFLFLISVVFSVGGEATVDFDNEVIPVLTKAGCNTGACHGAAVGRGGFKLSLYGGDPDVDFRSIVLDLEGRRVNLARADESLIAMKATESIEHGGGYRLEHGGAGAELLLKWVRQGTPRPQTKRLVQFVVSPQRHAADRLGSTLQLAATAKFSDGSAVDVTQWTVFAAEDSSAVVIDPVTAIATLQRRGRNIIVARYLDRVVPIEVIVPLSDKPVDLLDQPRHNFIDSHVLALLETLRLPVSPAADDASFLRRVTLDLTGRLPTVEKQSSSAQLHDPSRREALIDELLDSEEFNEYWTWQLAKLLRIRSQPEDTAGALTYHRWLQKQVAEAVPYDKFAREILMATGDTHQVGPANFYRTVGGARDQAEFASELFMGSRLRCANCHNHPLDRWTQDDYHGLAAIFAKVQRGRVITVNKRGEVAHPRTGEAAIPRIPGEKFLTASSDGKEAFAIWLTQPENPFFAKAIVNRLWKSMLGRGLVESPDDFRATNPATHPALLDELAADFVAHGYDLRHTLRRIATSATYGRSSAPHDGNGADDRYYSHAITKPLAPEVLADLISDVIGVPDQYGDQPSGTRAIGLFDTKISSEALDILGRCSRLESCESSSSATGGLPRTLHMFNGNLLNQRITDPRGRLAGLIAAERTPEQIVVAFYARALARLPTDQEREYWSRQMAASESTPQRHDVLEDFVWSLLTCRETVTNH